MIIAWNIKDIPNLVFDIYFDIESAIKNILILFIIIMFLP